MKTVLKVLGALVSVAVVLLIITPTVSWTGGATSYIKVTVFDDETDRPIPGVIVMVSDRAIEDYGIIDPKVRDAFIDASRSIKRTDPKGFCTVEVACNAGGGGGLFGRSGHYYIRSPMVIEADGYERFESLLQTLLGQKRFSLSDSEHDIRIYLKPQKKKPNQSLQTTTTAVTHRAAHAPCQLRSRLT